MIKNCFTCMLVFPFFVLTSCADQANYARMCINGDKDACNVYYKEGLKKCMGGDLTVCNNIFEIDGGEWAKKEYSENRELGLSLDEMCGRDSGRACFTAARYALTVMPNAAPSLEIVGYLRKACESSYSISCMLLGRAVFHESIDDSARESAEKIIAGRCDAGDGVACEWMRMVYVDRKLLSGASEMANKGCVLGEKDSCMYFLHENMDKNSDADKVRFLLPGCRSGGGYACLVAAVILEKAEKSGVFVETDGLTSRALTGVSCYFGVKEGCTRACSDEFRGKKPGEMCRISCSQGDKDSCKNIEAYKGLREACSKLSVEQRVFLAREDCR